MELLQGDRQVQADSTSSIGTYRQDVLPGTYTIRAFARGVRDTVFQRNVEVVGGQETKGDLSLEDLGTLFYVDDDALEEGDGSAAHPFRTIQEALESTSEGDTVQVMAGTYRGEPVELLSGVALLGAGPESTFLDGEGKRGVVRIARVQDVALEGFAIVGGRGQRGPSVTGEYQRPYGGILVEDSRHVRIVHITVVFTIALSTNHMLSSKLTPPSRAASLARIPP